VLGQRHSGGGEELAGLVLGEALLCGLIGRQRPGLRRCPGSRR
jgi:hypothetical protein